MSGNAAQVLTADTTDSVDDLRAMLANTEKLVETLRSELDLSERALKESEEELSKAQDENGKLEVVIHNRDDEIEELEGRIEELKSNPIGESEIEDLAAVRALLKKGEIDRARDGLERVLDGLDNCWRTRAATVVGQGALL
jgi:predicted nuclease with TOPRIM domain